MVDKFDPAPFDKHAAGPTAAAAADRAIRGQLEAGLADSFPASDPPSITQPALSRHDTRETVKPSLWKRLVSTFN
jgi:hypothetical protein